MHGSTDTKKDTAIVVTEIVEADDFGQFESRKSDHIRVAMDPAVQAKGAGFDQYHFVHEALPDLNFADVAIQARTFGVHEEIPARTPFFVSSMTAGHRGSVSINERLAAACSGSGWFMGVGSQRRELNDQTAAQEWAPIRRKYSDVVLFGNIGISQLIDVGVDSVRRLADSLGARGMIVHLNPLQECLQIEGTPQFKGGFAALTHLCRALTIPIIIKETGCGISSTTANRLIECGVAAIDVAGRGGTHWGRIEGARAGEADAQAIQKQAAETFANWGLSTLDSLKQCLHAVEARDADVEVWASGGIRSGLDAAKALALGAERVGIAQPILAAALESDEAVIREMARFEFELKTAMFCIGAKDLRALSQAPLVRVDGGGL